MLVSDTRRRRKNQGSYSLGVGHDDKGFTRFFFDFPSIGHRARQLPTTSRLLVKKQDSHRNQGRWIARNSLPGQVDSWWWLRRRLCLPINSAPFSLTTREKRKPSVFRNRKRTFQHQRLANTAGLFSLIPSQDSSPSTNHHNPLTSNSAKGASGRNRGISANGNSVASGRTGSGELVGWMERGNKMRGGLLKKGIALQGHICTVQRSKGGAVDGPCICFPDCPIAAPV